MTTESNRWLNRFLLPQWCRKAGFLLCIAGIATVCLVYVFDIKPDFLHTKVFAVFSHYLRKRYLTPVNNNITDEIIMLFFLAGLFLISFSRLKNESDYTFRLRFKALFISVYINFIILVLSVVFIYGIGFVVCVIVNCFSLLFLNAIVLWIMLLMCRKPEPADVA